MHHMYSCCGRVSFSFVALYCHAIYKMKKSIAFILITLIVEMLEKTLHILMHVSSYLVRTHGIQLLATKIAGFFDTMLL